MIDAQLFILIFLERLKRVHDFYIAKYIYDISYSFIYTKVCKHNFFYIVKYIYDILYSFTHTKVCKHIFLKEKNDVFRNNSDINVTCP